MSFQAATAEAPAPRSRWYDQYKVDIPAGESGQWKVERFAVDENTSRWSAMTDGRRWCPAGEYTRLAFRGEFIMSDTPAEIGDHMEPIRRARGACLVSGLGLGMVTEAMLRKPEVARVVVMELSEDVIALVAPTLRERFGDRLEVRHRRVGWQGCWGNELLKHNRRREQSRGEWSW